jgi:hypothetical protein
MYEYTPEDVSKLLQNALDGCSHTNEEVERRLSLPKNRIYNWQRSKGTVQISQFMNTLELCGLTIKVRRPK